MLVAAAVGDAPAVARQSLVGIVAEVAVDARPDVVILDVLVPELQVFLHGLVLLKFCYNISDN